VEGDVAAVVDEGARSIAASTWSATAPATAAIGVTKRSAKGAQAACMARAMSPDGGRLGSGVRSAGSSAQSVGRMAGKASLACA
jgi:hypothetical protein